MFSDKYSLTNTEPFSLVYSSNSNTSGCKNVLLIDNAVIDASLFASSVNDDTFPIIYASTSTKTELLALLKTTFTTIERIGLVFTSNLETIKPFLDCKPFFTKEEAAVSPYSENVEFIIAVLKEFNVKNIDYLACNTLNYPDWVNYYAILTQETNNSVVIGASNDETGNIKYGGDWVMENTSENIELIYFTKSIEYYTYLLDFSVGGGAYHVIAIKNDGTLWGAGWNINGALGIALGDFTNRSILTPMNISMITGKTPKYVFCEGGSTFVLMTDGTIWGTGANASGGLGVGNRTPRYILTQMVNTMIGERTPQSIGSSGGHTIVLMDDGSIWGTGLNTYGQLGIAVGDTTRRLVLTQMDTTMLQSAGKTPQFIDCNYDSTIVLMTDGTIWGTGNNTFGQLGIGNTDTQYVLTQMNTTMLENLGKTPQSIYCSLETTIVLMTDGTIWGTGANFSGELGIAEGDTTQRNVLTQMNTTMLQNLGKTPKSISGNDYSTIVLMTDGTIWGTGYNDFSVLGIGNTDSQTVLTQMNTIVIGGRTPKSIFCNAEATYVLMTDGTIWGTGRNSAGELGIAEGDTTQRNVLTQMGPNNNDFAALPFEEYVSQSEPIIADICFPAGTPVKTDQGIIEIQNIKPDHHTIGLKTIKAVTQTLSEDPDLICFEKDALYPDVPSEKTVMSRNHGVFYKGRWYKAQDMIDVVGENCTSNKIYRIPYKKGTILYNVLLETHSHMLINNLIVETLNPINETAFIYNYFNTLKPSLYLQQTCINAFNTKRQAKRKALMVN